MVRLRLRSVRCELRWSFGWLVNDDFEAEDEPFEAPLSLAAENHEDTENTENQGFFVFVVFVVFGVCAVFCASSDGASDGSSSASKWSLRAQMEPRMACLRLRSARCELRWSF